MENEHAFIRENNHLRKQLTTENEKFYTRFLLYIRCRSLIQDQNSIEEKLLEILQDILDAQADNISAEKYFGKDPKAVARDLLKQFPINLFKFGKGILLVLGVYLVVTFSTSLIGPQSSVDLGNFLLSGTYLVVAIFMLFRYLADITYKLNSSRHYLTLWLVGVVFATPIFIISFFVKTSFQITIGRWTGIALILLALIIGSILFYKTKDKTIWWPLAILYLSICLIGIATRLPGPVSTFLNDTDSGQYLLVAIILIGLIILWVSSFVIAKKNN